MNFLSRTVSSILKMLNQTSSNDQADGDLARQVQARDEVAFELLFERYGESMARYIEGIVRDDAAAQDLVQETFLRVWTRAEQWSGQGSFKSWLYRIAGNLALNHLRGLRRRPAQPLVPEEERPADEWAEEAELYAPGWLVDTTALGPDAALERSEERARIRRAVNGLPEEKREVFRLVQEMELSIRDAAGRLGIPEGTVKSRLYYAQKKLSNELSAEQALDTDQE